MGGVVAGAVAAGVVVCGLDGVEAGGVDWAESKTGDMERRSRLHESGRKVKEHMAVW